MQSGSRLGVYEIVGPLGAGGMGEVFRARDTRLQRDVALKLLPAAVAGDPERLARFTREAQVLAALNHPHIGAIHGLEESGQTPALVLELVEGPTLAERLTQGPIDPAEAVAVARQIADALEFAHEHGIVHRDLKPANIKLRPDGTVKVLDFGLAKALTQSGLSPSLQGDIAQSPTFTSPATSAGMILGTAAYMAPEQARGGVVDRRADIWAFGVVVFEMLTGRRPFGGDSDTLGDAMAAILRDGPAWALLPASTPAKLRLLLERTLEKDPRRRLRDIGDARLELEDMGNAETTAPASVATRRPALARLLPWAIAAVTTAAAIWLGTSTRPASPEPPALKYSLSIPDLDLERTSLPVLSPDGTRVVYSVKGQLWVRDLDRLEPHELAGASGALFPFWSPDSRQVAYLTATALWRAPIDGGPPVRIASAKFSRGGRTPGGVWRRDGTIVFAPAATGSSFLVVSADGGEFRELVARSDDEGDYHKPSLLPDGMSVIYIVDRMGVGADTIAVLRDGVKKTVFRVDGQGLDSPSYSPTGHLLYQRETTTPGIWAVPFSIDRLETTGTPFLVVPQGSWPAVGANGLLVYAEREITGLEELVWLDIATGTATPALNERFAEISSPRLSPDGTHVAAVSRSSEGGIQVIVADLQRHTHVEISDGADGTSRPDWRDARSVVYGVDAGSTGTGSLIMTRRRDGSQPAVQLFQGSQPSVGSGTLLFVRLNTGLGGGIFHVPLPPGEGRPGEPAVLLQTPLHEREPALAPNGKFLAYTRGDAGLTEVMLRAYPESSEQWQVSVSGGGLPLWSPAGDTIYFRNVPGQIYAVDVKYSPTVSLSTPRLVARPASIGARSGYDISRDGTRLLMVRAVQSDNTRPQSLAVVTNWFAEFKKDRRPE